VLKVFDKTVWLWRRIEGLLPWPGLSLIIVARNQPRGDNASTDERSTRQSVSPHA
jgi:hypothetical protein